MSMPRAAPLRVLVVVDDEDVRRALEHVIRDEGDLMVPAASVEEAVQLATADRIDVAFIELRVEGGAALALCHHPPEPSPNIRVQVVLHPAELDRGPEALSLGAGGVLVAPPTGEAIARVLTDAKAEQIRKREITSLEGEVRPRAQAPLETYDRLVRFARGAAPSDAVRAIVDGALTAELRPGRGALRDVRRRRQRTRLARLARHRARSPVDLRSGGSPRVSSRRARHRSFRSLPRPAPSACSSSTARPRRSSRRSRSSRISAAAMLSIVDRQDPIDESVRVFPPKHFRTVADRLLTPRTAARPPVQCPRDHDPWRQAEPPRGGDPRDRRHRPHDRRALRSRGRRPSRLPSPRRAASARRPVAGGSSHASSATAAPVRRPRAYPGTAAIAHEQQWIDALGRSASPWRADRDRRRDLPARRHDAEAPGEDRACSGGRRRPFSGLTRSRSRALR